ncbi:MAG: NADH-quinone oxidoreductase subunit C [Deltaproteobacteria bacterium]
MADDAENQETAAEDVAAESVHPLFARLGEKFPEGILATADYRGDLCATIERKALVAIMTFLRDQEGFEMLLDVTAVDYLGRAPRFEIVYHLVSLEEATRVRVKVPLEEADVKIPSLTKLWTGADWLERETFDMYGIEFTGHPNLKRIYLYEEFVGHPLRKDYPKEKRQPLIGPGAITRSGEAD